MADETPRTAVDDLVDRFVEGLTPTHHRHMGVPAVAIEVRKDDLRQAALDLLASHAAYLTAASSPADDADAGASDPEDADDSATPHRPKPRRR